MSEDMKQGRKRSVVKSITFRIIATAATIVIVYAFTQDLAISGTVGILDMAVKLIIYYFHERAWNRSSWGSA